MKPSESKSVAFITAYNEDEIIAEVLDDVPEEVDVYVIDDGSTDETAQIARQKGASVISHPFNMGQGTAIITAFQYLSELDYDYIIELDGDGQHDPKEIPKFVETLDETKVDIVAGSRLLGSNYESAPFFRKIGLKPLNFLLNSITAYSISDYMCGFRGFRTEALRKSKPVLDTLSESKYVASEMWIKFSQAGLTATDIPINLRARASGTSYKGHAMVRYGFGVLRTILRSLLDTYRER